MWSIQSMLVGFWKRHVINFVRCYQLPWGLFLVLTRLIGHLSSFRIIAQLSVYRCLNMFISLYCLCFSYPLPEYCCWLCVCVLQYQPFRSVPWRGGVGGYKLLGNLSLSKLVSRGTIVSSASRADLQIHWHQLRRRNHWNSRNHVCSTYSGFPHHAWVDIEHESNNRF